MQDFNTSNFINKKLLFTITMCLFALNFYTMTIYAERNTWNAGLDYIIAKSARQPTFFLLWLLILPILSKLRDRFPFSFQKKKNLLWHIFFCYVITTLVEVSADLSITGVFYVMDNPLFQGRMDRLIKMMDVNFIDLSFLNVAIYWLILAYYSSVDYLKRFKQEATKRADAEKLIAQAELNALKMQIQPHFLFNTLHSISSLMDDDTEQAQDMVGRLGELLRYTLDQTKDFIPVKTELEFIRNYLDIEKIRFEDRLTSEFKINEDAMKLYVPSFILQPIIENSIKHGLSRTNNPVTIQVKIHIEHQKLTIYVEDNGIGSSEIIKGIGTTNTENRLRNYFGTDYSYTYGNLNNSGFYSKIQIPIMHEGTL